MQIISDSNNTSNQDFFCYVYTFIHKNNNFQILSFYFAIKIVILEATFANLVRISSAIYTCTPMNLQRWTCY